LECFTGDSNDLWVFNTTISQWIFLSGNTTRNQAGNYGTKGIASPNNIPGGRDSSMSWIDSQNNLYLFGGNGMDSLGKLGK
jgi:hypothetical protein